jgi:hypothetical protein
VGSQEGGSPVGSPAELIRSTGLEKISDGVWQAKTWPRSHILFGEVALMEHGSTVYAAVGDLFGYLNLAVALFLLIVFRRGLGRKLFKKQ